MFKVIKKNGIVRKAYRLGEANSVLARLMLERKIVPISGGEQYEIFSREAVIGNSGHGQLAEKGDWIKLDSAGYPYPNKKEVFEKNHKHIAEDEYEEIPKELDAWSAKEPMCEEIAFLIREKGLVLNEEYHKRYYTAPLWGTVESADKDAVLLFYSISCGENGTITDASFNFIEKSEFEKKYKRCSDEKKG